MTGVQPLTDTLTATRTLPSNYANVPAGAGAAANQFGPWLPNSMLPEGIFFDDDGNPDTDAALITWYGYNPAISDLGWMRGDLESFAAIPATDIQAMGANLSYTSNVIDDLVNIGLNYVIRLGDVGTFPASANNTFTIRVTPTPDSSGTAAPTFVGIAPDPLLLFTSYDASVLLQPENRFAIGSLLTARVGDADLNQSPTIAEEVDITISTSTGLSDTLALVEQGPNRGVFAATLPLEYSNVPAGTVVTMTYFDVSADLDKTSSTTAEGTPAPILSDVSITEFSVPETLADGLSRTLMLTITNDKTALELATGEVLLTGSDGSEFYDTFMDLRVGGKQKFNFRWTADLSDPAVPETVEWVASVTTNDQKVAEANAVTLVEVKKGKNAKSGESRRSSAAPFCIIQIIL